MTDNDERFVFEEDPNVIKKLFGENNEPDPDDNIATIRTTNPDKIAKRAPAPAERAQPSFPKKEVERDLITFTPKRPKGNFVRMLQEKTAILFVSGVSLLLLGGIAYVVYVVTSNYMG